MTRFREESVQSLDSGSGLKCGNRELLQLVGNLLANTRLWLFSGRNEGARGANGRPSVSPARQGGTRKPLLSPLGLTGLISGLLLHVGAPKAEEFSVPDARSFNLTMYAWLAGVNGTYRAGPVSKSVDVSFIDIAEKLSNFPLAFMGRFEAHHERFGLYLDGNYMDLTFRDRTGRRGLTSIGLSTQLGVMDYGLMYRLVGPAPSDRAEWEGKA